MKYPMDDRDKLLVEMYEQLLDATKKMRLAQKKFFKSKKTVDLNNAISCECVVDDLLMKIRLHTEQYILFI